MPTYSYPSVNLTETDLSEVSAIGPQGVPAGVIGTATKGPAYVPITVRNEEDFISEFGEIDAKHFGTLAARAWLKSSKSFTYIRILGIGDGKKRNANGTVTNAGFRVDDQRIQETGIVGANPFSNFVAGKEIGGRVYFLGCFMSESNGSTIFSDANIQTPDGFAETTITIGSNTTEIALLTDGDTLKIKNFNGTEFTFTFKNNGTTGDFIVEMTAGTVASRTGVQIATDLAAQINAQQNEVGFSAVAASNTVKITQKSPSFSGNQPAPVETSSGANNITGSAFTGGSGGAVPILRGVLLAPSGVILHLSGANQSNHATKTDSAIENSGDLFGRVGHPTGSLELNSQQFKIIMNGYTGGNVSPSTKAAFEETALTASLDPTSNNYIGYSLNTDPLKFEREGHLLLSHFPIYDTEAVPTGSGILPIGYGAQLKADPNKEDVAFLLTSSINLGAAGGNKPDYEDFEDRFSHAETPFIISQGGTGAENLFKFVSLGPGENISNKFSIAIEEIIPSQDVTNKYGTFNVVIKNYEDGATLKTFPECSIDPDSPNYIARLIGDQNVFFDFDAPEDSQRLIFEGNHPITNPYIRVVVSDNVSQKSISPERLPFGFRGPRHLVTSGNLLSPGSSEFSSTKYTSVVEPPFPYRKDIATGEQTRAVDKNLYWGFRNTKKHRQNLTQIDTNIFNVIDDYNGIEPIGQSFLRHYPNHRKDSANKLNFSVGNNPGAPIIESSVVDCDLFNNNKFSLEHIRVYTGSVNVTDPNTYSRRAVPDMWVSASYFRNGSPGSSETEKYRAFKVDDLNEEGNIDFAKFIVPLQGGFDGSDIFSKNKSLFLDAAARHEQNDTAQGGVDGPTINAYKKAIDIMGAKDDVNIKLMAVPGIRLPAITNHAITAVENRFDSILLMDIEEKTILNEFVTSSQQAVNISITNTISNFKSRNLDSSFAAAFFPDVNTDINGVTVTLPPTIAALEAYSSNDARFGEFAAPAGVIRGVVDGEGAVQISQQNASSLYSAAINPIFKQSNNGLTVIWGQKTLQKKRTALDRVSVRRLLIFIRRQVRSIANSLLFEPNRPATLEKFTSLVNPILKNLKSQQAINRFKVVIDETTTTQADVENNTIRGKIFIEPARDAEFISIDFGIVNPGSELLS